MPGDEAVVRSDAADRPRPGLACGWTRGPMAGDASVLARTDVCSGGHRRGHPIHLLVVGDNSRSIAAPVTRDLADAFPGLCLDRVEGVADLADYGASLRVGDHVLMGLVTSEVDDIDALIDRAGAIPALRGMQWVVVTDAAEHRDLTRCMQSGALSSVLKSPWTLPLLAGQAYSTMVRYLRGCGYSESQIRFLIADPPPFAVQGPLLEGLDRDEREVVMELLAGVERVLGHRPRLVVPGGTQLVTQGEPVWAVYLVLDGRVSLHRDSARGEVLAHLASSGPLIGLVSLARAENAFFTGTTMGEATLVRLTTEQLQIVISEDPSIGATLTALAIRSLTRRLMRAEDLHLENAMLAEDLEAQKEALAATLEDLRATRAELVERARFAMLGELSAGIAHELNNPVTALVRAAKHLHEDVDAVLASPAAASSREAMARALTAPPRSTSVERALIKELLPVVGDRTVARRLVRAGVQGADGARALARIPGGIDAYEAGARLGGALRSVLAASDRVIELTQSLKGYARPDTEDLRPVDVRDGIDDVLRLTAHRVRGIRIDCDYEDVPPVYAHPAKLQQVWTNLIVNAAEAIEDECADKAAAAERDGTIPELPARGEADALIRITVRPAEGGVSVTISDNGPGIDPGIVDKIMEPHFTTKAGRIRFGLGMGMSIVRTIIADHGGCLAIDTHPGSTIMRILLPTQPHEEES